MPSRLRGKKILVVDDEPLLRELLCDIFKGEGAEIIEAENGTAALEKLFKDKFDIVFSDVRMPGGDGSQLMNNIKARLHYKPKLFLCSGYNDITPEQLKGWGALLFQKPFDSEEVIKTILQSLR